MAEKLLRNHKRCNKV